MQAPVLSADYDRLNQLEESIYKELESFNRLHKNRENSKKIFQSNQWIITRFLQFIKHSMKALTVLLQFLTDADILTIGALCKTTYSMLYSPLGYRISLQLRQVVIKKEKAKQEPQFKFATLENLCSERSLNNVDDDDKDAIILTMRTNLMATKQKIEELERATDNYIDKLKITETQMGAIAKQWDGYINSIAQQEQNVEKMSEVLRNSQDNIKNLKEQQQAELLEKQSRIILLKAERQKLLRQKEILIKKIKKQQKEKEDNLIYEREASKVLAVIDKIVAKKK